MTATREAAPPLTPDISVRPVNTRPRSRAPYPLNLYSTAVGKKWVMALTGVMLMGFVFAHMVGNLKMYLGPEELNHYGEFLRELLVPIVPRTVALWLMRLGLIGAFALHIHAAFTLTRMNGRSNAKYQSKRDYIAANFASRTMRITGIIFALFLIWHLADLTWGLQSVNPEYVRGQAYENVAYSLGRPLVAGIYIVGNLALGVHLYHGAWSLFQSLGVNNPRFNQLRKRFAQAFVVVVIGANLTFPIAVLAGVVGN